MEWAITFLIFNCIQLGQNWSFSNFIDYGMNSLGYERCNEQNTKPDFPKMKRELQEKLFGQHIFVNTLIPLLESHYTEKSSKALVICLHGWTGTGKNYATDIVTRNLFRKPESNFLHKFYGRIHFPLNKSVDEYVLKLQSWIKTSVESCPRSVFVFDEIEKLPPGLIDGIKPFFDFHKIIDGVDYRKTIFIFISNVGGDYINKKFLTLWESGTERNSMKYRDFEDFLRVASYETDGAFRKSAVIEDYLISLHVPFLPLEKKHVVRCIEEEIKRQNLPLKLTEDIITYTLDNMEFKNNLFSMSGCKRVSDLVGTFHFRDEL